MAEAVAIVGAAASFLQLVQTTVVVTRKAFDYIKTVKKASKERLRFKSEVAALLELLDELEDKDDDPHGADGADAASR